MTEQRTRPGAGSRRTAAGRDLAEPRTLCIDIGGSGLKAAVIDAEGRMVVERVRIETPDHPIPERVVEALEGLVAPMKGYARVSVGFPGVVKEGVVHTAANLGTEAWKGFHLADSLERRLGKPVRVANDADLLGFGFVRGRGIEMVVTLGTGFGTALFANGRLAPHLEIAHHVFRKKKTYDEALGDRERKDIGNQRWSRRVGQMIEAMRGLTTFDHLYISGGNASKIEIELPDDVSSVDSAIGMAGAIALWRHDG